MQQREHREQSVSDACLLLAYFGAEIKLPRTLLKDVDSFVTRAEDCGHTVTLGKVWNTIHGRAPLIKLGEALDLPIDVVMEGSDKEDDPLIRCSEAAKIMGISSETLLRWYENGNFAGETILGRHYFRKSQVDRFVNGTIEKQKKDTKRNHRKKK